MLIVSKRSNFEKIPKDFYATVDPDALPPKFLELIQSKRFMEPCFGNGDLSAMLQPYALCTWASDIREETPCRTMDASVVPLEMVEDCILTNPPFSRKVLDPMLDHWLQSGKDVWLLLPADFMHNVTFGKYMKVCTSVVSIGRLYWFKNTWEENFKLSYEQDLKDWTRKRITGVDHQKGIMYYSGWVTREGKPVQTEVVKSTDNFAWFCFNNLSDEQTVFYGR